MQTKQHGSLVGFHTHYQLKLKFNEPVGNHAAIGAKSGVLNIKIK